MALHTPFEAIDHLLTVAAGLHAVQDSLEPDAANPALSQAYEALDQAGRTWIADLASRLRHEGPAPLKKNDLYLNVVSKIAFAQDTLGNLGGLHFNAQNLAVLKDALAGAQETARHYIDHNEALISALQAEPDSKAKLVAYFGDMLVP